MPGPIFQMMRGGMSGRQRPPVVMPEDMNGEMDPDMSFMPPDAGNQEMAFPGGDMDYEDQAQRLGQPQMVHDRGQLAQRYGKKVPNDINEITGMMESEPQGGPIRERLHAEQHGAMLRHRNAGNQQLRMILSQKRQQALAHIQALKNAGRMDEADKIGNQLNATIQEYERLLNSPGQ